MPISCRLFILLSVVSLASCATSQMTVLTNNDGGRAWNPLFASATLHSCATKRERRRFLRSKRRLSPR